MAKRVTYKMIKEMSFSELNSLNKEQAVDMLKQFRKKLMYRAKSFDRAGKYFYSPALDQMEKYYEKHGKPDAEKMNHKRIRSELFHIQDFFKAESGDVKGARRLMKEQDIRIFGANEKGNPLKRMTREERTEYWEVYDEFLRQNKNASAIYTSNKIQQYLGEITKFREKNYNLSEMINKLGEKLREEREDNYVSGRNVRQGR